MSFIRHFTVDFSRNFNLNLTSLDKWLFPPIGRWLHNDCVIYVNNRTNCKGNEVRVFWAPKAYFYPNLCSSKTFKIWAHRRGHDFEKMNATVKNDSCTVEYSRLRKIFKIGTRTSQDITTGIIMVYLFGIIFCLFDLLLTLTLAIGKSYLVFYQIYTCFWTPMSIIEDV